jgi:hypothetical protein
MYIPILARPPVSSARLPGEIRTLVAFGVTHRRTTRAEPVIERVHQREVVLADIAAACGDQFARKGSGRGGDQRNPGCLVVDAYGTPGRGELDDALVVLESLGPDLGAAGLLDQLVHERRRTLDRTNIRVIGRQLGQLFEHSQGRRQILWVDPGDVAVRTHPAIVTGAGDNGRFHNSTTRVAQLNAQGGPTQRTRRMPWAPRSASIITWLTKG